jgi:hypothetical protein
LCFDGVADSLSMGWTETKAKQGWLINQTNTKIKK